MKMHLLGTSKTGLRGCLAFGGDGHTPAVCYTVTPIRNTKVSKAARPPLNGSVTAHVRAIRPNIPQATFL